MIFRSQLVAPIFLVGYCIKISILVLEVAEKRRHLFALWKTQSPEATSGVFNRSLFIWLNRLFLDGFRSLLTVNTLTPVDDEIIAASEPYDLERRWRQSKHYLLFGIQTLLTLKPAGKSSKNALLWTFLIHYKWCLLSGVLPRLAHTGLVFSQSFLIHRVLDYTADRDIPNSLETAHGLVGAYAIVYIGIAVGSQPLLPRVPLTMS
jgi:hypothetical protein